MDGIHDLGGKYGYGPVIRETREPVFHDRWEAKVFAIMLGASAAGAVKNTDQFRHAIERIDPVAYLTHGYYGRWLGGLETLLVEAGLVSQAHIGSRVAELGGDPAAGIAARPARHPDIVAYEPLSAHSYRPLQAPPRFVVGDRVRTRATPSGGHTRLPAYARGQTGRIARWHDGWVFPDSNAHGRGENPQHLYTVAFAGETLWGAEAEPGLTVHLDLFESYLEEL
jgi:nitrile hydratase